MGQQGKHRHSTHIILTICLLFLIPVVLAIILYLEKITLGNNTINHGQLITPPFSITQLDLYNYKGQLLEDQPTNNFMRQAPVHDRHTNGKWLMLYLYPGNCEKKCQQGLYKMRQIRLATGKNRDRLERALLTYRSLPSDPRLRTLLATQYKGTRHFVVIKSQFQKIIYEHTHNSHANERGTLFIVDPLGNIMMFYKPNAKTKGIFKDIQRLLKVSQIG